MKHYECLESFHPVVKEWFLHTFSQPSMPQELGWPEVHAGRNVLICAPTGSGKTLAAFLKCLDVLYKTKQIENHRNLGIRVVYVSPLKALNNDINRNLEIPIQGIEEMGRCFSIPLPDVNVAVRTGDTSQNERRKMLTNPPDILITTPESLFIMLTAESSRKLFSTVEFVIVDEIHAIVSNKRGAHLAITLERLEKLANRRLTRIGLSATLNPLEEVASYLSGFEVISDNLETRIQPRQVTIVNCDVKKRIDLLIDIPVKKLTALEDKSIWPNIYMQLLTLIRSHTSTLIFVNNRRQAEMVASGINNLAEEPLVKTHHGSMAKEVRKELETDFKEGMIPCLVATSTLELGIDIGHIDLVVQVGAPQTVSQMLQRIGRAGHSLHALSKGYIIPKTRADLLRAAFIGHQVRKHQLEKVHIPTNCVDILAQQITSLACQGKWDVEEAFFLVKRAYPYRNLTIRQFEGVLAMLSDPSPEDEPGAYKPRIMYDRVMGIFWGTNLGRMLSLMGSGTIPDKGNYPVFEKGSNRRIGELQEEFVFETRIGERFLLGTTVWRLDKVEHDRVFVTPTHESGGKLPFWIGDQVLWNYETGYHFGQFLGEIEAKLNSDEYLDWMSEQCGVGRTAAENLREYLHQQIQGTSCLPTDQRIVCEFFSDEVGQHRLIIHSSFGGKVNGVLGILLHTKLIARLQCDVEYLYNDEGILFHILGYTGKISEIFSLLQGADLETEMIEQLPATPIFNINLRYNLTRALLVNARQAGRRTPLWVQRLRSAEMVESISKIPDHPIIQETFRECFYDHLDVKSVNMILEKIRDQSIEVVDVFTSTPSPFTSEILFNFWQIYQYVADLPIAEKRNQLLVTDKSILELAIGKGGEFELLDERAIQAIESDLLKQKYDRNVKNCDDLYYFIFSLGELKAEPYVVKVFPDLDEADCESYLAELEEQGRLMRIQLNNSGERYWIAVEDYPMYCKALGLDYSEVKVTVGLSKEEQEVLAGEWLSSYILTIDPDPVDSAVRILRRWARFIGPFTMKEIQNQYPIATALVKKALKKLLLLGEIVQLKESKKAEEVIYCNEKVFERIRRKTVEFARLDIKPKIPEAYLSYVCQYQRVNDVVEQGEEQLKMVVKQLQGLFLPVEYWERFVLPARVKNYEPHLLDTLCSMGVIRWIGRLNHKTREVALYPGEDFVRIISFGVPNVKLTEREQKVYELLKVRPASFTYEYTQELKVDQLTFLSTLEGLVWKGLVTNDLFSPVRYYHEEKKKNLWEKYRSYPQTGRWSVIHWSDSQNYTEQVNYYITTLLGRYGILSKEILQFEKCPVKWTDVYEYLKQNELFSGIKRGVFLEGISGIQYARDEFIENLRLHETNLEVGKYITISASDPANLIPIFKGDNRTVKVTRHPGTALVLYKGRLACIIKQFGKSLIPVAEESEILIGAIEHFVKTFLNRQIWTEHSTISTIYWGEEEQAIEESPIFSELQKMGFKVWYDGIVLLKEIK